MTEEREAAHRENEPVNAPDPQVLDYWEPSRPSARTPAGVQFTCGLLSYMFAAAVSMWFSVEVGGDIGLFMCGYVFVLAVVFIPGSALQYRYGWNAFLPGALTGVGLTCLISPFAFFATCRV
jgi:hypothetical protein